ncbi:hypothetical protein ABZ621_37510 [Streptomyces sp. NPDC007863]|uniref:hypothetical protein n=1 Tax=Streptomyces sp. NPDC007863 TaxID=3154894 RepID=UPI0034089EC3
MPGFTVNRGYPYSVPTDPTDVAGDIQALAEAIDADVQTLQSIVGPRPMARVRGITPVTMVGSGGTADTRELPLELIDFNVGGAIAPLTSGRVRMLLPGMWMAVGTFIYSLPSGANIAYVGAALVDEANIAIGEVNTHLLPAVPETQRNMDVSGMTLINPGLNDTLFLRAEVRRFSGGAGETFRDRTLLLMRMTES